MLYRWSAVRLQFPMDKVPPPTTDSKTETSDSKEKSSKKPPSEALEWTADASSEWTNDSTSGWTEEHDDTQLQQLLAARDNALDATHNKSQSKQKANNNTETNTECGFMIVPHYLYVEDEPAEDMNSYKKEKQLLKQYKLEEQRSGNSSGEQWGSEEYVALQDPFFKFQKRIQRNEQQCVRYCFGGEPLWLSNALPKATDIPNCTFCGSKRIFELQLLPTVLSMSALFSQPNLLDFGVVSLFSCSMSCTSNTDTHVYSECIFVQPAI